MKKPKSFRTYKGTRDIKVPSAACPQCHKVLDRADVLIGDGPATPKPGDITMCIGCAAFLAFTEGLGLRLARPDELAELAPDQQDAMALSRQFIRHRNASMN